MEDVPKIIIHKKISDDVISKSSGKFFNYDKDWTYISRETMTTDKIMYIKEDGSILALLWKYAIPEDLCTLAVNKYMNAGKMVSTNRGTAAGSVNRKTDVSAMNRYEKGIPSNSSIIGYIDSPNHKRPCRLTSFSRDFYTDYKEGLPFIKTVDTCFKICFPINHNKQLETLRHNANEFRIENTAFSTVTVNYNFRTALHKDIGDFKDGLGNLVICTKDITGGEILFPQYKLAIHVQQYDFLAMDVHEWHCNNSIIIKSSDSYRLSFVCYFRENMTKCSAINENIMTVTGDLSGKSWDTSIIYHKIFECIGILLPEKTLLEINKPWWSIKGGRFQLIYRHKRYVLYDLENDNKKINNLIPSYNYALAIKKLLESTI
jgi:hypothetical protein